MHINSQTIYYALCDRCGDHEDDGVTCDAEEAEAEARRAGWTVTRAEDGREETLCPQCQAERQHKNT